MKGIPPAVKLLATGIILGALLALLGRIAHSATIASTAPNLPVTSYVVTDPATFPSLPLPQHALVYLDGLYQTPGLDYTISAQSFRFKAPLAQGDGVSIVALP